MTQRRYGYDDLKTLMQRLRDPQTGCPWDLKQDYASIVPHTLEEVYEVIDTIERQDYDHLQEELGDLVFQVVFYAQIAAEEERFTLDDIVHGLVAKLLYRHPHVFPEGTLESRIDPENRPDPEAVNRQWDALKAEEKVSKNVTASILDDVPAAMPGLLRAKKLQKKAASVGFDWPEKTAVFDKIDEELLELKEAVASGDQAHAQEELGDLLFVLANLSRHLKIDPEQALREAARKFEYRFSHIERSVQEVGRPWDDFTLEELDAFWNLAKQEKRY
ncbi:MAG: nucleoside triphosphate pyrophosphohydrolase [Saccharospirillum sp.]|nr:nucleoside triphosphate pyrophosphohydrolase [Saccharospirillum sp.]